MAEKQDEEQGRRKQTEKIRADQSRAWRTEKPEQSRKDKMLTTDQGREEQSREEQRRAERAKSFPI
jgi:hypothetical protein